MRFKKFKITGGTTIFPINNINLALDFYVDNLGFKLDWKHGEPITYAGLSLGNPDKEEEHIHIHISLSSEKYVGMIYINIQGEIDDLYNIYLKNNVEFKRAIETQEYGMREFTIADPFGNLLTFGTSVSE